MIKSQKFSPNGGSSGGSVSTSVPSASAPTESASPIIPLEVTGGSGETSGSEQAGTSQGGAIPAFVMESELTTAQEAALIIQNQSTLYWKHLMVYQF